MMFKKRLKQDKSNIRGFTIIELLIVLLVMTILFSVGYANYRGYARRQRFMAVIRQLEGDIRMTQTLASSGTKPDGCSSLKGYRFEVNVNAISYSIIPVCENLVADAVKTATLGDNITAVSTNDTDNGILFYVLGRGTDIDLSVGEPFVINITDDNSGTASAVSVGTNGEVTYVMGTPSP
jgi:prepilin-type N-terminal cleavage/methylation domain-containing protein